MGPFRTPFFSPELKGWAKTWQLLPSPWRVTVIREIPSKLVIPQRINLGMGRMFMWQPQLSRAVNANHAGKLNQPITRTSSGLSLLAHILKLLKLEHFVSHLP